jgi:hypothetical protein
MTRKDHVRPKVYRRWGSRPPRRPELRPLSIDERVYYCLKNALDMHCVMPMLCFILNWFVTK